MSATDTTETAVAPSELVAKPSIKGPLTITIAAVVGTALFAYLADSKKTTTFNFNLGSTTVNLPDLKVNAQTGALIFGAVAIVFAISTWFLRDRKKMTAAAMAISGVALLMSFFCWVGGGPNPVQFTGLLQGSLWLAVPLIYGAMSGVLAERSGVININIEGQLLVGAFIAAVVASLTHNSWLGLIAAPFGGLLLGLLLAAFATKYFVDQVVVGVVLNVLAVGMTNFLYGVFLAPNANSWNNPSVLANWNVPILSKIPIIGPIFFQANVVVYAMYVLVILVQFFLFHTRWGLRVRSVGEYPDAADSIGIKVNRTRFRTVLIASMVAGLGGAYLTIGSVGQFSKEMVSGQGFIALAAVIFGRWTPLGSVGAALLFGFALNLQYAVSILGVQLPSQFLLMLPYVVTIFAVAGLVGKVRAPGADGIPFRK